MKYRLKFKQQEVNEPILSNIILKTKTKINILEAKIDKEGGEMIIEITENMGKEKTVIKLLREKHIQVEQLKHVISKTKKCTDCGYCVSLCPVQAITEKNGEIKFLDEKCVYCGSCVEVCPFSGVKLVPGE